MRPPNRRLARPRAVGEAGRAKNDPLERSALHKVLVRLVLPVHVRRDDAPYAFADRFVFVVLYTERLGVTNDFVSATG
jgi:hypothetical protein